MKEKENLEAVKVSVEGVAAIGFNSFSIVVKDILSDKYMNIKTTYNDANLIASYLQNIGYDIPLVHIAIKNILDTYNIKIDSFIIDGASDGNLFSSIFFSDGNKIRCRPADGIALAILFNSDIYIEETIFQKYGYNDNDFENSEEESKYENSLKDKKEKIKGKKERKQINENIINELYQSKNYAEAEMARLEFINQMNESLNNCIEEENYEKASIIRDKINQYKNQSFLK